MPKADPINRSDDLFAAQLITFKNAIGAYATVLGLTPDQVASQAADVDFFGYILSSQRLMQNGTQQLTSFKDQLRRGPVGGEGPVPTPPVFGAGCTAVRFGVETRYRALLKQIKVSANYNESIGHALGIEGAERSAPDLATVQPEFDLEISGGAVQVNWTWGGNAAYLDMVELGVDRGDGRGALFLAHDTTPGYTDSTPFPATPTKWIYTAIFWLNDAAVGQWSKPLSIVVGG